MIKILDSISSLEWHVTDDWMEIEFNFHPDVNVYEIREYLEQHVAECVIHKSYTAGPNAWVFYFKKNEDLYDFSITVKLKDWTLLEMTKGNI